MLHHASQISSYPLIMFIKILIHILYMDACRTNHLLIDTRNRKTSLFRRVSILLIALQDMGIDESMTESFILRQILAEHIQVDNNEADRQANLRCSQSDAVAGIKGFIHIINQFLEFWIIRCNIFSHFSQHWLTININR